MRLSRAVASAIAVGTLAGVVVAPGAGAARRKPTVEFRAVVSPIVPLGVATTSVPVDLAAAKATVASCDYAGVDQLPFVPTTRKGASRPTDCVVFPEQPGGPNAVRYYLGRAGDLPVEDAKPEFVPGQGWTVKIEFTKAGSKAWDRMAKEQFHRQVAITYEGVVVSAPTIQPNDVTFTSFDGVAVVSGGFKQKEAIALAAAAHFANGR
jgi:hypothetical protein